MKNPKNLSQTCMFVLSLHHSQYYARSLRLKAKKRQLLGVHMVDNLIHYVVAHNYEFLNLVFDHSDSRMKYQS